MTTDDWQSRYQAEADKQLEIAERMEELAIKNNVPRGKGPARQAGIILDRLIVAEILAKNKGPEVAYYYLRR